MGLENPLQNSVNCTATKKRFYLPYRIKTRALAIFVAISSAISSDDECERVDELYIFR
jgi:hypothetical protein